jgi:hypothetical protein
LEFRGIEPVLIVHLLQSSLWIRKLVPNKSRN